MEDVMGVPVGVEGMYPAPGDRYLISTWHEYRVLLESGVKYALDLSHINILAERSGTREETLLQELLSSPSCIEIHVSGNDGQRDSHCQLASQPWWYQALLTHRNPDAVIFTEGGQTRPHRC